MDLADLSDFVRDHLEDERRGAFAAGRWVVAFSFRSDGTEADTFGRDFEELLAGEGLRTAASEADSDVWVAVYPGGTTPRELADTLGGRVWREFVNCENWTPVIADVIEADIAEMLKPLEWARGDPRTSQGSNGTTRRSIRS